MSTDDSRLFDRDKRQIESIVRVDIARGRGHQPNVTERFPRTFAGVDAQLARVYYKMYWKQQWKGLTK
jgi:hypothetical protein